jgi:hypothetical protein
MRVWNRPATKVRHCPRHKNAPYLQGDIDVLSALARVKSKRRESTRQVPIRERRDDVFGGQKVV